MKFLFWAVVVALALVGIMIALSLWYDLNPDGWPFRIWRELKKHGNND